MIIAPSVLLILMAAPQVGPNPSPLEFEPLPIPGQSERTQQNSQQHITGSSDDPVSNDYATQAVNTAIAGNQAILDGNYEIALSQLEAAQVQALAAGRPTMAGEIGLDRSRALILLERYDEAAALLDSVRMRLQGNAEAWVKSATVARLTGNLEKAQALIEEVAEFAPQLPSVGLEAGNIAWYSGDSDAARRSWQSVLDVAPHSEEARLAQTYLTQTAEEQ